MLSLYRDSDDTIQFDGRVLQIDCNFNVVLANLELSQNHEINEVVKVRTALKNYLDVKGLESSASQWDYVKTLDYLEQIKLYIEISQKLFQTKIDSQKETSHQNKQTNDDKSVYSFSEDADFIFASFMKDYNINLIEKRNNMHWYQFKALFVSLSKDTKIVEVMGIRNWKPKKDDSKEYIKEMTELQKVYALKTTQEEIELIEIERHKMSLMSPEERIDYAKKRLKEVN